MSRELLKREADLLNKRQEEISWAQAIIARIEDELPYKEDNGIISKAVAWYLWDDLNRCEEFIGTKIIEEEYMEECYIPERENDDN